MFLGLRRWGFQVSSLKFSSCINKADWKTKTSNWKDETSSSPKKGSRIFVCTCSGNVCKLALGMTRKQEAATRPHWLRLVLEQTVWSCSHPDHKSLHNLNIGCKVPQIPSKATVETRNPVFNLLVTVSLRFNDVVYTKTVSQIKTFSSSSIWWKLCWFRLEVWGGRWGWCCPSNEKVLGNPGMLLQASAPGHVGSYGLSKCFKSKRNVNWDLS